MGLPCSSSQNNSCYYKSFWQDFGYIKRQDYSVRKWQASGLVFPYISKCLCDCEALSLEQEAHSPESQTCFLWMPLTKLKGQLCVWGDPGCCPLQPLPHPWCAWMCLLHSPEQHPGKLDSYSHLSLAAKTAEGVLFLPFVLLQSHSYALTRIALPAVLEWLD